ncbi:MAG: potassium channel family protein [Acidimicrobiales bacterium]
MLAVVVVLLTVQRARVKRSARTWMDVIIVAFGSLAFAEVVVSTTTDTPTVVTFIGKTLLAFVVLMSVPAVLRRVLVSHRIDLNVLAGALVAYLLIGLFFALLYGAVSTVVDPFFAQLDDPAIADDTYFSFITIATVGYGDLSPAPGVPRSLAVLEAVIGQVFLVTIVARVVSNLGSERELPQIAELDGDDDAAVTPDDDDRPPAQA